MDFLNKLGKKASETYQITKEKTVRLSEELKLKGKINDTKEKIEDIYKEIGEKVYSQIKNGEEVEKEEIVTKCEEITRLLENIEKSNLEILSLKNMKKCANCNVDIENGSEFCSNCGEKQPKESKINVEIKEEEPEEVKEAEIIDISDADNEENNK